MKLTSSAFMSYEEIPPQYTCKGVNINPPLSILEAPSNTESYVLICEDIDAQPIPWVHWLLFNIPSVALDIDEGTIPEGAVEGLANDGMFGYEGSCPVYFAGLHDYVFTLYALNTILSLPAESSKDDIMKAIAISESIIAKAELVGTAQGEKK